MVLIELYEMSEKITNVKERLINIGDSLWPR